MALQKLNRRFKSDRRLTKKIKTCLKDRVFIFLLNQFIKENLEDLMCFGNHTNPSFVLK